MDQVKKFLATLGKYHFWLLVVVAMLVVVVGQFLAAGALSEKTQKNRRVVKDTFDKIRQIQSKDTHPNEKVNQAIAARTDAQRNQILALWSELYGKQKKEVLHWPKALGQPFLTRIENLKFGAPLDATMRELYLNRIEGEFRKLPAIVHAAVAGTSRRGAELPARPAGRPAEPRPGGNAENADDGHYLVTWDDFEEIVKKVIWPRAPSSLKVWITQEDLWVYQTLLNIIKETNAGAKGHYDAVIKEIRRLKIGQDAANDTDTTGHVSRPGTGAPGSESRSGSGGARAHYSVAQGGENVPGRRGAGGEPGQTGEDSLLKKYRYLDAKGVPMAGGEAEPTVEFKRLPVLMELVMDEREIPRLLAECANAPLPVEVTQVRVNPAGSGSRGSNRSAALSAGGVGEGAGAAVDPSLGTVIIQGIIYIYNPPNREALGLPPAKAPVAEKGAAPATASGGRQSVTGLPA